MNKTASIKVRRNGNKFGLTLGALILAVLLVGMAAVVPGPVSAQDDGGGGLIQDPSGIRVEGPGGGEPVAPPFGAPAEGEIIFQQPPYDPWVTAYASDKNIFAGCLCIEDFWGLTGDICDIHWYGLSLTYPELFECDPTGMEFEIIFYQDAGGFPGAPVATFSNISPTVTYLYAYAYSVYRFDVADLGTRVSLTNGWVSIQSTSSPNGCSFWWLDSPTGNINAIQQGTGNLDDNLAFALTKSIPPPNVKYLHSQGGLFNLTDPIGTQWHELYPLFCREYHLSSWEDNGDGVLSPSDQIDMYEKPDGEVRWYHVDEVTITLYVTPRPPDFCFPDENGVNPGRLPPPMYIELEGGYNLGTLMEPISSHWHEIYPNFCTQYELIGWNDTAEIGRLDFCDYILLGEEDFDDVFLGGANLDNHMATCWHVEEVAVDITVTIKPPPVGGEAYPVNKASLLAPWIAVAVLLAGGAGWLTLRRRRAQS